MAKGKGQGHKPNGQRAPAGTHGYWKWLCSRAVGYRERQRVCMLGSKEGRQGGLVIGTFKNEHKQSNRNELFSVCVASRSVIDLWII